MKKVNSFLSVTLLLLILFTSESASQYQQCTQFVSPKTLQTFGTAAGTIQVPISGDTYKSNQICEWTLITGIVGNCIRLEVTQCSLQGRDINKDCNYDYVDIFDYERGDVMFKGRFCGSDIGKVYLSSGNKMTVRFHSDAAMEFDGFTAVYKSVPIDTDDEDEENENILNKAIGIPVGIIAFAALVIFVVTIIRCRRHKKASARSPQTTTPVQNASPPRLSYPGGYPSSGTSHSALVHNMYHDARMGNTDLDPLSGNIQLQVTMPGSIHEGSRNVRSITPPPAYDSLDLGPRGVELRGIPLTPPPYEMIIKQ